MTFADPRALQFLLLIPAVILLYFLRLRRREVVVSSTLLWSKVLEDRRVNSPFQRFRKSLLLLLQILVLCALAFALARPQRETALSFGRTHLLLVDVSASMAATEGEGSRLQLAREKAREYLDAIPSGERAVLIHFARRARALTPVTEDRALIASALERLEVRPTRTRLREGLELALSIARNEEDALAVVFSDGAFPPWDGDEIPFPIQYVRVGETRRNAGVVALSSRRDLSEDARARLFVEIRNHGDLPASGDVSILKDGELVRAAEVVGIEPGGRWTRSFDTTFEKGLLEVIWEPVGEDHLALDDHAWLEITPRRDVLLWHVGSSSYFLDEAIEALPEVRVRKVDPESVESLLAAGEEPVPDVILWDAAAPESLPAVAGQLFIGALPPGVWEEEPPEIEAPPIVSWDRRHPVNRFLSFGTLEGSIKKAWRLPLRPHVRSLVDTRGGSIIVTFTQPGIRGVVVGFDLLDSLWPLELSFPLFMHNAVSWLGRDEGAVDLGVRGEELLVVTGERGVEEYTVTRPDGAQVTAAADPRGRLAYADTDRLGPYRVSWQAPGGGETESRTVTVNLLEPDESDISPRDTLEVAGREVEGDARTGVEGTWDLWPWLLALALAFLLGEWYCYHRR